MSAEGEQPDMQNQEAPDAGTVTHVDPLSALDPTNYEGIWDHFEKNGKNFFENVEIAKDGGFSEVGDLTGGSRYFTTLLVVFFVGLNIYYIVSVNVPFVMHPETSSGGFFTIIKSYILKPISSWTGDSFNVDTLPDLMVIGVLELGLLTWQVATLILRLIFIACPGEEHNRWHAVQTLFWNVLPSLSTLSALKMLNFVTPAVLLPRLGAVITKFSTDGKVKGTLYLLAFLITRALLGLVGFDVFLFKMQIVSEKFVQELDEGTGEPKDEGNTLNLILLAVSFLNQLLGIVQLGWFVKVRIFEFIFAGEDGMLDDREAAIKETWEAMLAMKIWQEPSFSFFQKFAVYCSYSDVDFQKLALESVKKTAVAAGSGSAATPEAVPAGEISGQ